MCNCSSNIFTYKTPYVHRGLVKVREWGIDLLTRSLILRGAAHVTSKLISIIAVVLVSLHSGPDCLSNVQDLS